jgi:predicted methyltransferase
MTDTQSDQTRPTGELNDLGKSDRRQLPTGRIVHGDCIEHMRAMQRQSVDFILTDPP